jgi:hypothetical protein
MLSRSHSSHSLRLLSLNRSHPATPLITRPPVTQPLSQLSLSYHSQSMVTRSLGGGHAATQPLSLTLLALSFSHWHHCPPATATQPLSLSLSYSHFGRSHCHSATAHWHCHSATLITWPLSLLLFSHCGHTQPLSSLGHSNHSVTAAHCHRCSQPL